MWQQIRSNRIKTVLLVFLMTLVLFGVGFAVSEYFIGGGSGMLGGSVALLFCAMLIFISYYSGDKILLSISGARKIDRDELPQLYNIVEEMKLASGFTKMPDIYVIDDSTPNAFATGRNPESASVAVTTGLLEKLNRDELQGVIAHEMAHIVNRDVLLMMMLGIMLGAIVMVSDVMFRSRLFYFGGGRRRSSSSSGGGQAQAIMMIVSLLFLILAPFLAQIIYFAVSRKREYLADACSAQFTRYPEGLASALNKISGVPQNMRRANNVTAPMYIVNPLANAAKKAASLTSTHPPIQKRIAILRSMGGAYNLAAYQREWNTIAGGGRNISLIAESDLEMPAVASPKAGAKLDLGRAPVSAGKPAHAVAPGMQQMAAVAPQGASTKSESSNKPVVTHSEMNDLLWSKDGYTIIDCKCGVRLKVPPKNRKRTAYCPKCKKHYLIPATRNV